jgi:ABC-type phosphate transport system substrate-binding protein
MNVLANQRVNIVQSEGVKPESVITFPVGVEGIAVYVNKSTSERLPTGSSSAPNKRILLYAGESSTGVLPYFQQAVLQDSEPYPFVGKASAKELVDTVAAQAEAIGYSSIYHSQRDSPAY